MTDEELALKANASSTDWWARANALGVVPDADSWSALNPGADWAGNEDRAAELSQYPDQTAQASLRSDHPADHYVRQALDEQERNSWDRSDQVDDQSDEDVA